MEIKVENTDGVVVITPDCDKINSDTRKEVTAAMIGAKKIEPKAVVLNLINVKFIDSMGLGGILLGRNQLLGICGVRLCGLNDVVENTIQASRLNQIFPTHRNVPNALKAIKESSN